MNEDYGTHVASVLDALAERFGATGAHLWEVMVRQAYIDAVVNTFVFLVFIAFLVALLLFLLRKHRTGGVYDDWGLAITMVGVFGGIISVLWFSWTAHTLASAILNPEYVALRMILGALP